MLKKLALVIVVGLLALGSPALAQNPQTVKLCVPTSGTVCPAVTASAPLPVSGSFSATLAGFTPNGNYTTLTATASSSASTNLPAGTVVAFQNLSSVDVSCVLTAGASTATTNKLIVRAGATVYYTVGSNTTTACINQTGSASNVVGLAGGAGLGTAFGGASSGGGGGGAVTIASGAVASGAYSAGSIAAGAFVSGSILSGALASGAVVDITNLSTPVAANTATATKGMLIGGQYDSTQKTLTNGQQAALSASPRGALYVATGAESLSTQPSSATVPVSTMNSASANSGLNSAVAGVFDDTSPTAITENSFGFLRMSANRNLYGTIRDAAGNERGVNVDASNRLTTAPTLVSGSVASGAYASGAFASGSIASGALASGSLAAGAMVDLLTMRQTVAAGTVASNSLLTGGQYNSTPITLTNTQGSALQLDANGYLKVNTAAGAAAGGTSSNFGSAFPTPGTAIGFSDGTNMVAAKVGAVANVAAATNMVNTLAVGQYNATPVTVTDTRYQSLQLDVNGYLKTNVTNTNANGQAAMANSSPVVIASNQSAVPVSVASGGIASGAVASGAYASGAVASGAYASGSLASGAVVDITNMSVATGAAPPSKAIYLGANTSGATGGLVQGLIQCDSTAIYDASTNGSTELVALTSGRTIYVCGYTIMGGGTVNVKLIYGTGTACATGSTNMTPAFQLTAQAGVSDQSPFSRGLKTASANALCINTSAGVAAQAIVYYAKL